MSESTGSESCTDHWKSQLDMDRQCGTVSSEETCWLCDDLIVWNRVMSAKGLELEESRPGMLLLRCAFDKEAHSEEVTAVHQASFLASWLLRHHPCIQEVTLTCPKCINPPVEEPPIQINFHPTSCTTTSRKLRGLYIRETSSVRLDLRGLDAVIGLETLYVDVDEVNQHLATQIDELMAHNLTTLRKVDIWEFRTAQNGLAMIENLVACEYLTVMSAVPEGRIPHMDETVHLMRVSTKLKEVTAQPIYQADLSLIAKALATNRTLTKLSFRVGESAIVAELFRSLEVNDNLKDLTLVGYVHFHASHIRAVASALAKNSTLRSLHMEFYDVEVGGMKQWSKALSKNCALHLFSIDCQRMRMSEVSALCKCLRVNKTLKTLQVFPVYDNSEEESTSLAQQLLADDCYDRVRLGPWTEPYLKILSPVLASTRSGADEILLPDIGELSLDSVSALCNSLASNKRVDRFFVAVTQEPDARVALLCEAIKKNRHMKYLQITIENVDSAKAILHALTINAAVAFLDITLQVAANRETVEAFSDMLTHNGTITGMSVWLEGKDAQQFLDSIEKAVSRNKVIVSFISRVCSRICIPSSILESVRRNKGALNRAVEFVLQRRDDRRGAECFELFVGRPCMMTHLTEVAGITDVEARLKVVAAEHRIQEKYFVFAGIVRHSIVCWPADVTQIDALNPDCWRAIACYLKLTDVCSQ